MGNMLKAPFYDPERSYEDNFKEGPFNAFADGAVLRTEGEPLFDFFGFKVYSPFGIPAGPLINGKFVKAALDKGFDIATYKTVRTRKYPCHAWPNVLSVDVEGDLTLDKARQPLTADHDYKEPLSITNSFGVPSFDPEFWQSDFKDAASYAKEGQIVVGGFQGTKSEDGSVESYINDFKLAARMLKAAGAKVLEVNLSCPNEGTANLLCFDTDRSKIVVGAIKDEIGDTPLIAKIGYFTSDAELERFASEVGSIVDGISAINTIAAEIVDRDGKQALPGEGRSRSGVCGHSIKWAGLEMVGRLKKLREKLGLSYTIVGVGGVTTPEDFDEYIKAGADFVMSATGAMWDPYLAKEIKERSLNLKVI
jgi:dihydroorotate dehydrogenase